MSKHKIVEVRNDLIRESFPVLEKRLFRFLLYLRHLRAAHLDPTVGPVMLCQVTLDDVRDSADDALRGKIVLA